MLKYLSSRKQYLKFAVFKSFNHKNQTAMRGRKNPEQTKTLGRMFVADVAKEYNENGKLRTLCKIREKYGIFYRVGSAFIINTVRGLDINNQKDIDKAVTQIHNENKSIALAYQNAKKE